MHRGKIKLYPAVDNILLYPVVVEPRTFLSLADYPAECEQDEEVLPLTPEICLIQ